MVSLFHPEVFLLTPHSHRQTVRLGRRTYFVYFWPSLLSLFFLTSNCHRTERKLVIMTVLYLIDQTVLKNLETNNTILPINARNPFENVVCLLLQKENRCVPLACQPTSPLILNQHQPPATNQSAVLSSYNKSAPTIRHSQANTTNIVWSSLA